MVYPPIWSMRGQVRKAFWDLRKSTREKNVPLSACFSFCVWRCEPQSITTLEPWVELTNIPRLVEKEDGHNLSLDRIMEAQNSQTLQPSHLQILADTRILVFCSIFVFIATFLSLYTLSELLWNSIHVLKSRHCTQCFLAFSSSNACNLWGAIILSFNTLCMKNWSSEKLGLAVHVVTCRRPFCVTWAQLPLEKASEKRGPAHRAHAHE